MNLSKLTAIDRRWIFLLIGLGTLIPILIPIGFPVRITPPVRNIFDKIETLGENDVVVLSYDYGPTTAAENDPMADAVLRQCLLRKVKVIALALYPLGGLTAANSSVERVTAEFPDLRYGVDYVNLGYKDGGQASMKLLAEDFAGAFPGDTNGTPLADLPLMQRVKGARNAQLAVSIATGIIGEWWANLINAQYGLPVAVGCTAVSAPKYYAYLEAGQMLGLIGGLKGASEYEQLLIDNYPQTRSIYSNPMLQSASKGMDVQTIDHLIIIGFIVLGNIAFFAGRRAKQA
ncbi:MAG: hypothetical protein KC729_16885 [Candidatus Eisenbacteria bacterium]|uniref:Uncharacterized protein n=1 Tax=Eiseniibacteriota bacterium TaxID=2212470 RepID=A0A956M3B0_UNCEI|nr:hypothetical protein [Candidatus Eisenbacteria bacterium]